MGDEMVGANKSSEIVDSEFYKSYNIMVVDDDITCLSIVAAQLKKWKYQVVTVKHARDALCILRFSGVSFDVIVSDVHMPDMNGFELQRVIAQEFDIPVVFMSADDRDSMVLEGLERGAIFFLMKPISPDDLRDIWQYAALAKKNKGKGKSVVIEEIQENNSSTKSSSGLPKSPNENVESSSSINVEKGNKEGNKEEPKKKSARKYKEAEKEDSSTPPKKTKLVWTDALHNKFLQAIREIGLDRAYPRTILEVMDVPGLTRENVASHLQKYRIFLRKVTEESLRVQAADTNLANSATQSTFGSKGLSTMSQLPQENSGSQQLFLKNKSLAETSNRGSSSLSNRRATPAITLPGYGKAKLVSNKGDSSKITSSNANQVSTVEAARNQTKSLIHEDISTQLLNAAILANRRITRNLNSLHNSSAAGERHESNQSLVQRDSSLIGFERDKGFAAMLTSYLNQGANRTQLTQLPNNVETGGGSGTVLDQDWPRYFNQGANRVQLTRVPNNFETGGGSGTKPGQDCDGEKQSAAMWSSYFNQGANRMQLTRLPNNAETGGGSGTKPGQDCEGEKRSAVVWSSYLNQGANSVQLTRFPNNFEAGGGSGTKPGQDGEGEKQSAAMWSSYLNQGANSVQLTQFPNNFEAGGGSGIKPGQDGEGEKQSAAMWSSYLNQGANSMQLTRFPNNFEAGGGSGTKPGQDGEGEKQSAAMWSSYLNQGANSMQLTRFPNNFEAGGGSGTKPGQDGEGEKQSAAMWSSYLNQGANSVQLTRFPNNFEAGGGSGTKPGQDGEGEKQSAAMWSSYLNQEANHVNQGEKQSEVVMWSSNLQLTRFPNNVETGGGSGTKLGQDYDVSMSDKNNATLYSSGIGDLTSTFYSQLNVQPFHVESSNNQEETTFNFTVVNNQDQEAYYPLPVDYTQGEQGDHRGVTAEEGSSSQLHHTLQNPELEHGDDKDFWDSLLSFRPYNGDQ